MQRLARLGIAFPGLSDSSQLVRAALGGVANLVTIDLDLQRILRNLQPDNPAPLNFKVPLKQGYYSVGPIPFQYWVNFIGSVNITVQAGLDSRGFASGRVEEGMYFSNFTVLLTGGISAGTGLINNDKIIRALKEVIGSINVIEITKIDPPRIEGEITINQSWVLNNSGEKMYVFASPSIAPELRIEHSLIGTLMFKGGIGVKAVGWAGDIIDGANEVLENAAEAYTEIVNLLKDIWGFVTGHQVERIRKPEWEIEKTVEWKLDFRIASYEYRFPAIYVRM
jgi:hypothetical protein